MVLCTKVMNFITIFLEMISLILQKYDTSIIQECTCGIYNIYSSEIYAHPPVQKFLSRKVPRKVLLKDKRTKELFFYSFPKGTIQMNLYCCKTKSVVFFFNCFSLNKAIPRVHYTLWLQRENVPRTKGRYYVHTGWLTEIVVWEQRKLFSPYIAFFLDQPVLGVGMHECRRA